MKSLTFSLGQLTVILELLSTKELENVFFKKKNKPDCIKLEYVFNFFIPHSISFFETLQFQIHKTLLNLLLNPNMFMVSLSPAFLPTYLSPFQYAPPAFSASIYLPRAPCSLTF